MGVGVQGWRPKEICIPRAQILIPGPPCSGHVNCLLWCFGSHSASFWYPALYSKLHFAFLNFTHTYPTSHRSSMETITWPFYCFPAIIPIMPPTWDYLSCLIVSWLCWDPDQVTFPLPLSYLPYSRIYFQDFHGHSLAPHHYHCSVFHVLSILIVFYVLSFLVSIFLT